MASAYCGHGNACCAAKCDAVTNEYIRSCISLFVIAFCYAASISVSIVQELLSLFYNVCSLFPVSCFLFLAAAAAAVEWGAMDYVMNSRSAASSHVGLYISFFNSKTTMNISKWYDRFFYSSWPILHLNAVFILFLRHPIYFCISNLQLSIKYNNCNIKYVLINLFFVFFIYIINCISNYIQ